MMGAESDRLKETGWKKWGPYVSDRQWGTVREDYSADGDAWNYLTHDMARSRAYRWGEDGIAGICDTDQHLCFAIALWNKKDPIIKERYFGLSNAEGNHGEDVKELYYYLDNTPTHSYMKMLYKYPQQAYPYNTLLNENKNRGLNEPEFELIDTGVFDQNEYFDVFVEYAKRGAENLLIRITIHNRADKDAALNILPTIWFRNTWSWGYDDHKPALSASDDNHIIVEHPKLSQFRLIADGMPQALFCENETNTKRFDNADHHGSFFKDGINDHLINGLATVNNELRGTKAAFNCDVTIAAGQSITLKLMLTDSDDTSFGDFDDVFAKRIQEADEFYRNLQLSDHADKANIQRQAFAGMLWNKQFYYYDIHQWLNGDPKGPVQFLTRKDGRNSSWGHYNACDIISMPDKWEYPWFAAWDLAFHCVPLATIDMVFAKRQLNLLVRDWYMHPNGQLPAYEWDFSDANPPVHALATWRIYQLDKENNGGKGDTFFLERVFHKLMLNFTWWVNRKDEAGNNIFEGGFLGLDNIGVFDRNTQFGNGTHLEQADGTSWMAMYALNLLRIATELAETNKAYEDIASKFFEHFIYIAGAMANLGEGGNNGLWDDTDGYFYDQLRFADGTAEKMRVRSIVGLIPLFAAEVLDDQVILNNPIFKGRMDWFTANRPDLAGLVSHWNETTTTGKHLISLLRGHRMKGILRYMLDEKEFLSPHGIRSLSKYYLDNPYSITVSGKQFGIKYIPAESDSRMFGGNSNWRGPVWMPINYLIIQSLMKYHEYYGDEFTVECPVGSGRMMNLKEVANEIYRRVSNLFLKDKDSKRAAAGPNSKIQNDPEFKDHMLFYEYFDGDTGEGLGAAHQTGWTGLIANCLYH